MLEVLDKLPATVVAMMVLLAIVDVAILLILWGLALRAYVSGDHRLLLTSTRWSSVFSQQ
jgi:hypothetical protein